VLTIEGPDPVNQTSRLVTLRHDVIEGRLYVYCASTDLERFVKVLESIAPVDKEDREITISVPGVEPQRFFYVVEHADGRDDIEVEVIVNGGSDTRSDLVSVAWGFDQPVNVPLFDHPQLREAFQITDGSGAELPYGPGDVSYNPQTSTLTIDLRRLELAPGPYTASITGGVVAGATDTTKTLGELSTQIVTVKGDYDGDGDVDGRDFLTWQRGHGSMIEPGTGADGDGDGDIDGDDLAIWQTNYGTVP
jgi:hypothetical protein